MKKIRKISVVILALIIGGILINLSINKDKYKISKQELLFHKVNETIAEAKCGGCMKEGKMSSTNNSSMKCGEGKCGNSMKEEKPQKEKKVNSESEINESSNNKNNVKEEKTTNTEKTTPEKIKTENSEMKCAPGKCGK